MKDDADALTPLAAAQHLERLEPIEATLQARVEGLVGMTWSLVSAAIFLTYAAVRPSGAAIVIPALLWFAAAVVFSTVLRRSVAVALPPLRRGDVLLLVGAAVAVLALLAVASGLPGRVPTAGLILIALSLLAYPLARAFAGRGVRRVPAAAASILGIVTGAALVGARSGDMTATIAAAAVCATWFTIGAWETLRG